MNHHKINGMEIKINQCLKCEHQWIQRTERTPAECPRCKSRTWSKPRIRKQRKDAINGNEKQA